MPNDFAEAPLPEGPALRAMALCALARSFVDTHLPEKADTQNVITASSDHRYTPPSVIPRALGEHFQVHVHLDLRQLRPEHKDPLPAHDCPLSEKTLRRLSCDASRVAIIHGGKGEILSVGRRSRGIPPALRRALRARDQGCRFPGCSEHRHVEAHHVEHWAEGGDTALSNLVELCHHHHRLVHEGGFSLRANADGNVVFVDPKGQEIANSWPRASLPDNPVQRLHHRQRHLNIDWRSCRSGWTGEPLNINDAIQVLETRGWLGLRLRQLYQSSEHEASQAVAVGSVTPWTVSHKRASAPSTRQRCATRQPMFNARRRLRHGASSDTSACIQQPCP